MIHDLATVRDILLQGALPGYRERHVWAREVFDRSREPELRNAVPQRLHFIWIGAELPDKYRANIATFVALNPMYEVNLWTDRPYNLDGVRTRNIRNGVLALRGLFESEPNLGAKADIARYEIVHAEGGMYYDIDSYAVKPFDSRPPGGVFARAWVPAELGTWHNLTNAMFGMPKGSRFLDFVMACLNANYFHGHREVPDRTGPTFLTTCFLEYNDPDILIVDQSVVNPIAPIEGCYTVHTCDHNWR